MVPVAPVVVATRRKRPDEAAKTRTAVSSLVSMSRVGLTETAAEGAPVSSSTVQVVVVEDFGTGLPSLSNQSTRAGTSLAGMSVGVSGVVMTDRAPWT